MYTNIYQNQFEDRQFLVPFLGGALIGGAAVGLTRPRPVYVNGGYYPTQTQNYGYPYGYSSYSYYYPRYY
jgi:hypothetical protein